MTETENATPETGESLQVLQKEYDTLWSYIIHLDKERRDAVRFLFTAVPGVPAAIYGVASTISKTPLGATQVAPWMSCLLAFLCLLGGCYYGVIVASRVAAVGYTRKLNLTRQYLLEIAPARYFDSLSCLDGDCLCPDRPDYAGRWRTDFWYRLLVVLGNSVVAGAAALFFAVWGKAPLAVIVGVSAGAFVLCALGMLAVSEKHLKHRTKGGACPCRDVCPIKRA